jgi:hypothetical protein
VVQWPQDHVDVDERPGSNGHHVSQRAPLHGFLNMNTDPWTARRDSLKVLKSITKKLPRSLQRL